MQDSFEVFVARAVLPDGLLAAVLVDPEGAMVVVTPSVPDDEVHDLMGRLGEQVGVDLLSIILARGS